MASLVDICNLALQRFGGQTITALDQASPSARACNLFWPNVRDSALRDYPWNFCMKQAQLVAVANETDPEWSYIYQYPADCLRIKRLYNETTVADVNPVKYIVRAAPTGSGKRIYANLPGAYMEFHSRITDTTQYDPEFVDAIAWRFAADLSVPLSDDKNLREHLLKVYAAVLEGAIRADANEGAEDPQYDNQYLAARF